MGIDQVNYLIELIVGALGLILFSAIAALVGSRKTKGQVYNVSISRIWWKR